MQARRWATTSGAAALGAVLTAKTIYMRGRHRYRYELVVVCRVGAGHRHPGRGADGADHLRERLLARGAAQLPGCDARVRLVVRQYQVGNFPI